MEYEFLIFQEDDRMKVCPVGDPFTICTGRGNPVSLCPFKILKETVMFTNNTVIFHNPTLTPSLHTHIWPLRIMFSPNNRIYNILSLSLGQFYLTIRQK